MAYKKISDTRAVKLQGGAITDRPKALLPLGAFSMVQNLRPKHPGFEKRKGHAALHTTADSTNQVLTLYQFNKQRKSEQHFYAQMSDGDILEATNDPPTVTTGVFGTEAYSGSASQLPASWCALDDKLIHSNGVDQHQIYAGTTTDVEAFIVYKGAAAIPDVPELGEDYTVQVTDSKTTTAAILDSLSTVANYDCVFVKTGVPITSLGLTMKAVNSTDASTTAINYWNGAWTAVSGISDGTISTSGTQKELELVIDNTNIDSTLTNFPVRVHISNSCGKTSFDAAGFFTELSYANRKKMTVKNAAETQLYVEIEADVTQWDSTNDINLWVRVPSVASGATTTLTLNYDSSQAENTTYVGDLGSTPAQTVWDSDFLGVYHLAEDPSGGASSIKDSTSNETNGTPTGTWLTGDRVTGNSGYGLDFESATAHYIHLGTTFGDTLGATSTITMEGMFNRETSANYMLSIGDLDNTVPELGMRHQSSKVTIFCDDSATPFAGIAQPDAAEWHYICGSYDGTTLKMTLDSDVNGDTQADSQSIDSTGQISCIGAGKWSTLGYDGIIDEVRFSQIERSAAWKKATYYSNADTLITLSGYASATLGQSGTISFTEPADIIPKYLFGQNGFWYQIHVSAALDAEVEVSGATYGAPWQDIANLWDGALIEAVEVQVEGTNTYAVFGSGAVTLDAVSIGKKIMISCSDPIVGFYVDVGATPNTNTTAITALKYWNGTAMASVGTITDGTAGFASSGFITFGRQATVQPLQFGTSRYYAYWYEITLDAATAADMVIGIQYLPYYDIEEFGKSLCSTVWKERVVYAFNKWSEYLYVTKSGEPLVLNGGNYGILKAGDGRTNRIRAMRRFHNELMVWQEEKGTEGGCLTLFEGYSPSTFGKLLLSSKVGTMSDKTVEVVDGVLTSTATDESIKTLAFFLSRYGVCATDGRTVSVISDDIQNYFDPTESECIRRGYEDQMWLKHDSAYNVIRIGLVSGASATTPNIFPVFDLTDKVWYFDTLGQSLSCMTEVEAQSGNVPVVQVGGGVADGLVYQLNTGLNDVSTAIDSYLTMELTNDGFILNLNELIIRMKVQAAGNATVTITQNELTGATLTLAMTAAVTSELIRRHRENVNVTNQHISIKLQHDTASQSWFIYDLGLGVDLWEDA